MTNPMMQSVAAIARRKANAAAPSGSPLITSTPVGTLRNDYTGNVGMLFEATGSFTVTSLGRWALVGNTGSHTVGLWTDAGTLLASVSVDCSSVGSDGFVYAAITPVACAAGAYRIASSETNAGDEWYTDESYSIASGFSINTSIFGDGAFPNSTNTPAECFVPVNLLFE